MDDTAALLREREVQALRWFLHALVAASLVWAVGGAIFITSVDGKITVFSLGMAAAAIDLLLLRMLARGWALALVGFATVAVAFAVIAATPYLEWEAAGIDKVPGAYLIKTGLPIALVICALSALTLNPRYPLLVTGLTLAHQLAALTASLADPRTTFAVQATWEEHIMGPELHPGRTAFALGLTIAAGLGIALVAWVARLTVRRAVALEKANGQLRRYFSPEVAERISEADSAFMRPGGRVRDVVVLVSDLAGFTRLSHELGPDETLKLLADYQARMTAEIFREGGSVDKFLGDGILATFGATGALPDAAARAVRASVAMCRALGDLNDDRARQGRPPIAQRIGLHCGSALVGNVGSADRLEFTVIGDVVNLASRIEQACKVTGDSILASRAVADEAGLTEGCVDRGVVPLPGVVNPPALVAVPAGG